MPGQTAERGAKIVKESGHSSPGTSKCAAAGKAALSRGFHETCAARPAHRLLRKWDVPVRFRTGHIGLPVSARHDRLTAAMNLHDLPSRDHVEIDPDAARRAQVGG